MGCGGVARRGVVCRGEVWCGVELRGAVQCSVTRRGAMQIDERGGRRQPGGRNFDVSWREWIGARRNPSRESPPSALGGRIDCLSARQGVDLKRNPPVVSPQSPHASLHRCPSTSPSRRCLSPLGIDARGRAAPHRECVRRASAAFWVYAACRRWVKAYTTPCIACKHPHAPHSVVHWGAAIPPGRPPSSLSVFCVLCAINRLRVQS